MGSQKFEVRAVDDQGDIWIVAADTQEAADAVAQTFRDDGYRHISIIEIP